MEELENIKKQFDELMAKAEEIVKKNERGDERWRAEEGGKYWYVDLSSGAVGDIEDELEPDSLRWGACNYFQTKEEADKVAQHFRDYLILRADAKGFVPESDSVYYEVYYDYVVEELRVRQVATHIATDLAFETERDAIASIEKHGNTWKRYLGVEE